MQDFMTNLMSGGFLRGYRSYLIGTALIVHGIAQYLSGDLTWAQLWPNLFEAITGMGIVTAADHKTAAK